MNHKQQDIHSGEYYRGCLKKKDMCCIFAGFGNIFNEINITTLVPFLFPELPFLKNYGVLGPFLQNNQW